MATESSSVDAMGRVAALVISTDGVEKKEVKVDTPLVSVDGRKVVVEDANDAVTTEEVSLTSVTKTLTKAFPSRGSDGGAA